MNEVAYALCKKQVIGVAMWLSSMCIANQALHDAYVDFSIEGDLYHEEINIPMDEKYSLFVMFKPENKEQPNSLYKFICSNEMAIGSTKPVIDFELKILDLHGKIVSINKFSPDCSQNVAGKNVIRFGVLELKKGKYKAQVTNKNAFAYPENGKFQILMRGVGAGFP
ncbi:hypothetical protein HZU75_06540 [Chitinibacter fontanus]|uniref:Uncharacterized protein n=1 Tax=Chitinibacter fontanus TaxID=1737446 RepID=A0A7D5V975_9NEIS|nr:hypothetical protein [Chitinibacter fontanus]QLI81216.1 hypothetical protein HZU75_06540 [Chitinibacter fontanus]